jgi:hypothetical protein
LLTAADQSAVPTRVDNVKAPCDNQITLRLEVGNRGPYSSIKLYSHTAENIARAIMSTLPDRQNIRASFQVDATETYRHMRNENIDNTEDPALLATYLHLFDQIFFFGALENHCYLEVVSTLPPEVLGKTIRHREPRRVNGHERLYRITIQILDRSGRGELKNKSPQERLHNYLGTLLHEALYAVFDRYISRDHAKCKSNYQSAVGEHGHKYCWKQTAELIEKATLSLPMGQILGRLYVGFEGQVGQ